MKIIVLFLFAALIAGCAPAPLAWTLDELETLQSLSLDSLPPLPPDPSNRYADDARAAALGEKLFFDARFSINGQVSCATCHKQQNNFQDNLPLAQGVGQTTRRTMPIAGTAYSPWQFWDGRKDSQWAQALAPLESAVEHGADRTFYAHLIAENYRAEYEQIFGALPDLSGLPLHAGPVEDAAARAAWEGMTPEQRDQVNRIFANMGKAMAAYERLIQPAPSRFDAYVRAAAQGETSAMRAALTPEEEAGLKLFIGKGQCTHCHNGPLLTDYHFHNTGVPPRAGLPEDRGRIAGVELVQADEFNCLGAYSDAAPEQCEELRFILSGDPILERAFKAPSLRNVAERAPYMHAGQFGSLAEVLAHYNAAPAAPAGHQELAPLLLSAEELRQLEAFLRALSDQK
ncbi:MAG TPA: cytochrome c peroxidase [Anaerolineaceae bacterium]|nr:cytochrome c peroxidase [Anaerolineaceae bacterium]